MKHPRLEERWLEFAEGTLPPAEAEELTAHLGNCEECDARYRRLAAAHRLSMVVGPGMRSRTLHVLEYLEAARHAAPQPPPPAHGRRVPRKAHRSRPLSREPRATTILGFSGKDLAMEPGPGVVVRGSKGPDGPPRIDRFELVRLLGADGMGEIYGARDTRLGRDVVLRLYGPASTRSAASILRLQQFEARLATELNHPNVLAPYFVGEGSLGRFYVVSELVEGETLRARLSKVSFSITKALAIALQIAQGLAAVHEKGIVHRNLNSGNVVFTRARRVKIFGIAESAGARGSDAFDYMSPEQVRGDPVDARSDLFALGGLLYELLCVRRPFTGKTPTEIAGAILYDDLAPLGQEVPARLSRIVARCLQKRPDDRFQTARDLIMELKLAAAESDGAR